MRCFIIFGCLILSCDAWNEAGRSFHFYDRFHISKQLNSQHPSIYDSTSRRLDTGNQRSGAVFCCQTKLMTGRHATWEDRRRQEPFCWNQILCRTRDIFHIFLVFYRVLECSSAQVEMFFQDLKSSVLNVFTHALTTQKISMLASQVFNTICL